MSLMQEQVRKSYNMRGIKFIRRKLSTTKEVVFTGIQPTGHLHIGNYIGSLRNLMTLQ